MIGRLWLLAAAGIAVVAALPFAAQGCSALPWANESDLESARMGVAALLVESVDFEVPAKGYLEAEKASGIAVPRVPTGALKVKEVTPEGTIVEEGDVVVVFDDTQLNIDLENHNSSFQSTGLKMDRNQIQADIELGAIGVMKDVAILDRDNAESIQIVDESIFSKLEILEEIVRKEEASETILFADASLELRGEYYDIEERILDVEKKRVQGDLGRVETSLGNLVLRAPIGGLVLYKKSWRGGTVAVGDTLWPGNLIMSLVDPASTVLTAFVLEKDSAGVEVDSAATITIDARPGHVFHGKVKSIAEISRPIERDSPVKYSELKITLEDAGPDLLKPGMKGEARIITGHAENALVLPRSALRGEPENPFVLVRAGAAIQRRPVKLGPGDQVRITILEGIEEGEMVLLGGESSEPESLPADEDPASQTAGETATGI
jgi:multidrug efflux pump subunit AcrA (membrane-fusion protein)